MTGTQVSVTVQDMSEHREMPVRPGVRRSRRWLSVVLAALCVAGTAAAAVGASGDVAGTGGAVGDGAYRATIVRTAYGVPHITADDFASLGFGYGFAFATDDICTMANDYVTVEGLRSRYFGPAGTYTQTGNRPINNLDSDVYWTEIINSGTVDKLLSATSGPGALTPQVRELMKGYAAGYDDYLASVGGSKGVSDPACRGQAWVRPITVLDAYLRMYQVVDYETTAGDPGLWTGAQPPAVGNTAANPSTSVEASGLAAKLANDQNGAPGSNAIAIGSAGTRDGGAGILLGNPHFPWDGAERFYQAQMTIPGQLNVEGVTLFGTPLVTIGFNSSVAWSHTVSPSYPMTLYQLALVSGHPTEYIYNGQTLSMTSTTTTVEELNSDGRLAPVTRTIWSSRWGPIAHELEGYPLPWTSTTAYALADMNASNFRFLNEGLATDEATSISQFLAVQQKYEGMPWVDTIAADSQGHAMYSDLGSFANVTDALAASCNTALGTALFQEVGMPVLDGSRTDCALGTDADAAAPGIFGVSELPTMTRDDYVENSNMSYWYTNASAPVTGYPRILGIAGTKLSLRTRSALTMVTQRIAGTDNFGPAGFMLQDMQNLMYSDIQYGATLVKPQLVQLCESLPGGVAPTSSGGTIPVGDACQVLAAWNGREDPDSEGAVLFREFWERALALPESPWSTPFSAADPVNSPNGLSTTDKGVLDAFGDALSALTTAGLPYDVSLGSMQYVVRNGVQIPMLGGPGDPDGDFNAFYQNVLANPGTDPSEGSSYIQAVTWDKGTLCSVVAKTVLTYSESDNPGSPHYADQTKLFSSKGWVNAAFCVSDVAAQAVSVLVVSGHAT